ncbi:MAG: hypothetical protein K6F57_01280 [Candidatus Saccharibacteria bacterium]|nr:hypothetical protein [Candidatus Saccharibacteria bacterium]
MKYYLNGKNGKLLSDYQAVKHYDELVQDGQKPNLRAFKHRLSAQAGMSSSTITKDFRPRTTMRPGDFSCKKLTDMVKSPRYY